MTYPKPLLRSLLAEHAPECAEQYVVWRRSDGAAGILAFCDPGGIRRSLEVTEDRILRVVLRTDDYSEAAKALAAEVTVVR